MSESWVLIYMNCILFADFLSNNCFICWKGAVATPNNYEFVYFSFQLHQLLLCAFETLLFGAISLGLLSFPIDGSLYHYVMSLFVSVNFLCSDKVYFT